MKYHIWAHIEEESPDGDHFHEAHEPVKLATHGTELEAAVHVRLIELGPNFTVLGDRAARLLAESEASGSLDTGEAVEILRHLSRYTAEARNINRRKAQ